MEAKLRHQLKWCGGAVAPSGTMSELSPSPADAHGELSHMRLSCRGSANMCTLGVTMRLPLLQGPPSPSLNGTPPWSMGLLLAGAATSVNPADPRACAGLMAAPNLAPLLLVLLEGMPPLPWRGTRELRPGAAVRLEKLALLRGLRRAMAGPALV